MTIKAIYGLLIFILLFSGPFALAQNDTLMFESGEILVGALKSMTEGVLRVETKYSDSDFNIEWKKVAQIHTRLQYIVHLSNSAKYHGRLHSLNDTLVEILSINVEPVYCQIKDIVYLSSFDDRILDRFDIMLSLGIDLAQANDLRALTARGGVGYQADRWYANTTFSALGSYQEGAEDIRRINGDLNYRYDLPRKWYAVATVSVLSNSEQMLDMRWNSQIGMGNFLARTNSMNFGAKLGGNRNIERYTDGTENRESWEGYFGNEINLFDIGDLKLFASALAYLNFTEKGRWRAETKLDLKYDLPLDFFISLNFILNYDNKPPSDVSEFDYLISTGFGWELD